LQSEKYNRLLLPSPEGDSGRALARAGKAPAVKVKVNEAGAVAAGIGWAAMHWYGAAPSTA